MGVPRQVACVSKASDYLEGHAPVRRLGFIMLPTDATGPKEIQTVVQNCFPRVVTFSANAQFLDDCDLLTVENYQHATTNIAVPLNSLRPVGSFDAIGVACTSWAFGVGAEYLQKAVRECLPDNCKTAVVDMATSLLKACRSLGLARVNLFTPYKVEMTEIFVKFLAGSGVQVVAVKSLGLDDDFDIWKVPPPVIKEEILQLAESSPVVDGVVVSCSALRMLTPNLIDEIEAAIAKPVVTSMQAFMWQMLRVSGEDSHMKGFGRLLEQP